MSALSNLKKSSLATFLVLIKLKVVDADVSVIAIVISVLFVVSTLQINISLITAVLFVGHV